MKVVAPDIWTPHTKAVRADLSSARIIFDLFHTVAGYHWEVLVRPGRARPYGKHGGRARASFHEGKLLLPRNQ